jgi:DNA-binding NarL/FixJ family response regulator
MVAGRADSAAPKRDHLAVLRAPATMDLKEGLSRVSALREECEARIFVLDPKRRAGLNGRRATSPSVRVVIADGHALVRAGFRVLLENGDRIAVVGEAGDGEEAVALARRLRPDVVLIDANLPGLGCVEATRQVLADPGSAVMLLTGSEGDGRIFDALRAGASGLLLKDTEPNELVRAVELLANGDALLSPALTRRLLEELASRPEPQLPSSQLLDQLTAREREVVALVALGLSNDEIAEELVVTPATAKTHVSRAMVKLQVRDRAQLVVFAYENGLVLPRAEAPAPHRPPLALA